MKNLTTVDVNEVEFSELLNQVLASGESRLVSTSMNGLALLSPLVRPVRSARDANSALLKAAGSWKHVDAERLKRHIREWREAGTSPKRT